MLKLLVIVEISKTQQKKKGISNKENLVNGKMFFFLKDKN